MCVYKTTQSEPTSGCYPDPTTYQVATNKALRTTNPASIVSASVTRRPRTNLGSMPTYTKKHTGNWDDKVGGGLKKHRKNNDT